MISEREALINESDLLVLHLESCTDWQLVQDIINHVNELKLFSDEDGGEEDDV